MSSSRGYQSGSRATSALSQSGSMTSTARTPAANGTRRSRSSAVRTRDHVDDDDAGSDIDDDDDEAENAPLASRQRKRLRQIKDESMNAALGDSQLQPEADASTSTLPNSSSNSPTNTTRDSRRLAAIKREVAMGRTAPSQLADDEDEEIEEVEAGPSTGRRAQVASQEEDYAPERHADGFIPGSIVRVKLENFVTYDAVEFYPGPHLNMIIGPNGTGKSAIVCAITLGLGWKPAVLGRAKDVASFVKQGHETGFTEIELKGLIGEPNVVVRRIIQRKNNSSEYRLNGKKATSAEVKDAVGQFDIDIANLCCFLPQDKVAEFARMDAPTLLHETEKAAGDSQLYFWHEKLNKLGKEVRVLSDELDKEKKDRDHEQGRNDTLSRDVERYEERRRLEDEVAMLEVRLPFAQYSRARVRYAEAKEVRIKRKAELSALRQANRPLEEKVKEMEKHAADLEKRRGRWDDKVKKLGRDILKHTKTVEELDGKTQDLQHSRDRLKDKEAQQQALLKKLKLEIGQLEAVIGERPEQADTSEIDQELRRVRTTIRQIEERQRDIQAKIEDLGSESHGLQNTKDEVLQKLQRLDDERGRKLGLLKQADPHAWTAVNWLRVNQGKFEKKVYEPVMLEVSVKDSRFTSHVESCINWAQMRSFVCQTRADYDLFTRELIDGQKLKLNVTELEGSRTIQQMESQRPFQLDEIRRYGFDDFMSNLVEAPEPVLQFLYTSCHWHLIPVAFRNDTVNLEQVESTRQLRRYVANGANHTVQYSEYGSRLAQTMSRDLQPPRSLGQAVNMAERQRLDQVMRDVADKLHETESKVGELQSDMTREKEELQEARGRRSDLEAQRQDAVRALHDWERAKIDVDHKRKKLQNELNKPSIEVERERIAKQLEGMILKRLEEVSTLHGLVNDQLQLRSQLDVALLTELQNAANWAAWRDYLRTKDDDYVEAENRYTEATQAWENLKNKATKLQKSAQAQLDLVPQAIKDRFIEEYGHEEGQNSSADADELQKLLFEKRASLELAQGVSPAVIEAFKQRAAKIKKHEENIATMERDFERVMTKLNMYKDKWLPALESLIQRVSEKFSAAFDRIGCAGEVRLSQAEDHLYEKWGIDILVKFRDSENLQLLTGQRQSGGERSLSTILYLMSLTELYRCPFSLVDEINQGMDQRAERAVHDQMVEVTCRSTAGQYFLITPKLLPNLRYHERMKVLIVNNGEWLPERIDLNAYIKRKLGGRGAGGSAAASSSRAIAV